MTKLIVILGPTACGKSDLAVRIAKKIGNERLGGYGGAEIISVDSRQVYKGLDIGTGKIATEEMQGIPHHLLDVASPNERFTVARWKELAEKAIEEISARGNLPIICGGTGYYISALIDNMSFPEVQGDPDEQRELEAKSSEELFAELQKLAPERAAMMTKNGERQNKRRLARAILVARALQARTASTTNANTVNFNSTPSDPTTEIENGIGEKKQLSINSLKIGLFMPDQELRERIRTRLVNRMEVGMIKEAVTLHEQGLSFERMDELGLEYRYLAKYLQKLLSKEQLIEILATKIWQYARRQKTWFRRDKDIQWFQPKNFENIEKAVVDFL